MIDIHSHILHGIDDGASDIAEAVAMAELAVEGGTKTIIATPHINNPWVCGMASFADYLRTIDKRKKELESELINRGIELNILTGMEVFATQDLADCIRSGRLGSMPDGKHYLIEFDYLMPSSACTSIIRDATDAGASVIIAHPERYHCVQEDSNVANTWREMGCKLQINLEGVLGKAHSALNTAAWELIKRNLVTYVASDAHDPYFRTPFLADAYGLLSEEKGRNYANRVLHDNALRLIT